MAWEKIDAPGGPSPRSGHRMVLFRKKLVLFGGFQDNNRSTPKYFNDVLVVSAYCACDTSTPLLSYPQEIPLSHFLALYLCQVPNLIARAFRFSALFPFDLSLQKIELFVGNCHVGLQHPAINTTIIIVTGTCLIWRRTPGLSSICQPQCSSQIRGRAASLYRVPKGWLCLGATPWLASKVTFSKASSTQTLGFSR